MLINDIADTLPAWLSGIGGILAAGVSAWALYRAMRAEERHVEWQRTFLEPKKEGAKPRSFQIVNTTSGVTAHVLRVEEVTDGRRDAVTVHTQVPAVIEHGNAVLLNVSRSLASGYPTVVEIAWRESTPHRKPRRRVYKSTFYFD